MQDEKTINKILAISRCASMSSYYLKTKHPLTDKWEKAMWIDDYFGSHHYGVKFSDDSVWDPEKIKLETEKL